MRPLVKKSLFTALFATMLSFAFSTTALAHVTVKPATVPGAAFQTFTVAVPVEKDIPTTQVKVEMPAGLKYVTPTVKPGWKIDVEKAGSGEDASVKSITWSGGSIDAGLRDEFTFAAQVPATKTDLNWKAYQTYQDGSVVSWDKAPSASSDAEGGNTGPYSITKVGEDEATTVNTASSTTVLVALYISIAAGIVGLVALFLALRPKK